MISAPRKRAGMGQLQTTALRESLFHNALTTMLESNLDQPHRQFGLGPTFLLTPSTIR